MLKALIEEWLAGLPSDEEAVRIMADELRLPAARVLSVGQFANDPILSPRMIQKMATPNGREIMLLKSPHKFSKTPPEIPGPAAPLGAHSRELLRSLCGYSDEKISALIDEGLLIDGQAEAL
jgi:crotonobetainyl-CoA:carnitine CoA-transferase CaiB-like acyl-CoA transferase